MTGVLDAVAPGLRVAALSGPSLALEVARGIPTAVVAASRDEAVSSAAYVSVASPQRIATRSAC